MAIYKNLYTPYTRYFFFLKGKCFEIHNICKKDFSLYLGHYNEREVKRDSEHFPVVGEIKDKEIVNFVLSKILEKE